MTTSLKITSEQTEGPQTFTFTRTMRMHYCWSFPSAHYNSPISKTVRSPGSTMTRVFCEYFRSGSFEPFSSATKLPWNVESWFVWPHNSDGSRKRRKLQFFFYLGSRSATLSNPEMRVWTLISRFLAMFSFLALSVLAFLRNFWFLSKSTCPL